MKFSKRNATKDKDVVRQSVELDPTNLAFMQEFALEFMRSLQSTLEIDKLIDIFADGLNQLVPYDSLNYIYEPNDTVITKGKVKEHKTNYRLRVEDKHIGEITLTRNKRFSDTELNLLEFALSMLVNPLQNCIKYNQVLAHAMKDTLTDVGNRRALEATLHREVELGKRHQQSLTILMLDLDNFKIMNDNLGHVKGDRVLQMAAGTIIDCVRDSDVIFRYGGDEFVIILRRTEVKGAIQLAERIRVRLNQQLESYNKLLKNPVLSTSIGVATLLEGDSAQTLIERADKALYSAKQNGRNQVDALQSMASIADEK